MFGGFALRSSAFGGGNTQALDCLILFCARLFFANMEALTLNFSVLCASDVKRSLSKLYMPLDSIGVLQGPPFFFKKKKMIALGSHTPKATRGDAPPGMYAPVEQIERKRGG
jgi:hypothetical protein